MQLTTNIICPYCGHKNKFTAEKLCGRELYNCFVDEGGCDGTFVVEYSTHIMAKVKRIEGEEKYAAESEDYKTTAEPAKPKLIEDEEIFVRWAIEFGFEWIARDSICGTKPEIFRSKPIKGKHEWKDIDGIWVYVNSNKVSFSFIKWEDAEPVYLPDLLGDCE